MVTRTHAFGTRAVASYALAVAVAGCDEQSPDGAMAPTTETSLPAMASRPAPSESSTHEAPTAPANTTRPATFQSSAASPTAPESTAGSGAPPTSASVVEPTPTPRADGGVDRADDMSDGRGGSGSEIDDDLSNGGAGGADAGATDGAPSSVQGDTEPMPEPESPAAVEWPIINGVQWADTEGNPIQAHGGGVLRVGDDYYWFGENRNADGTFYAVSAYRSRDLQRWERVNDVLTMNSDPELDPANVERPKVVYNTATDRYVMWMHWENGMDYGAARAAVASSDTVDGDYVYHGSFRPLQDSGVLDHDKPGYMSRDCTLFVDDDGAGYFISASNENYDLHLYALSDDYLSIDSRAALLFEGGHREAPALFKRKGIYFLLTSGATGWDPNQAQYATSTQLTSGWSNMGNVGDSSTFHSQSTYVLPIEGSEGTQYLYLGDRWAGAWGGRVNDSTYVWLPLSFDSDTEMSMSWANNVKADAGAGSIAASVDTFTFVNDASEMLLSVAGAADENSADLAAQERAAASNFEWRFNYDGAGYFTITNEAGGKVIDIPDESTEAGVALHLWDGNGGDHQAFRLIDLGAGRYHVVNKKSGLVLAVADAEVAGAAIEQQMDSGAPEQVWRIEVAE